ncbi:hypothetical protein CLOSYM_02807 [[Clostridium] symbiosum ATCC 14940]|uniref:Uncharacterized protein n=1 Tax=[Clostridium] symbiosum ATCC 14940 TaxID=411472 RepID=A0ABC9TWE2_CLOSY|nr:hypothetical protein CLOSYM_02807 [[Clostridium] symbiosum ATCC 14940]
MVCGLTGGNSILIAAVSLWAAFRREDIPDPCTRMTYQAWDPVF